MSYEVFYKVDKTIDSIVIEGESLDEINEKTKIELKKRNGTYKYSNWLND